MLSLDIRSLFFFAGCVYLAIAIGLLTLAKRGGSPYMRLWALSVVMTCGGYFLYGLRGVGPDYLSIVAANAMQMACAAFAYAGSCRFLGRKPRTGLIAAICAAVLAALVYFTYEVADTNARVLVLGLGVAPVMLMSAAVTARAADRDNWPVYAMPVASQVLIAAVLLVRAAAVVAHPGPSDFMASGTPQVISILGTVLGTVGMSFGFASMHSSRLLAEVEQLGSTDSLSRLQNRRSLDQRLDREFALAQRKRTALSVLLVDIDHFKRINDNWGHQAGDQAIEKIGAVLRAALRPYDTAGRFGGEEFMLLLPHTSPAEAEAIAERVCATDFTVGSALDSRGAPLTFTVSVGVACVSAADTQPGQVVLRADQALYAAKHAGRNRVALNFALA